MKTGRRANTAHNAKILESATREGTLGLLGGSSGAVSIGLGCETSFNVENAPEVFGSNPQEGCGISPATYADHWHTSVESRSWADGPSVLCPAGHEDLQHFLGVDLPRWSGHCEPARNHRDSWEFFSHPWSWTRIPSLRRCLAESDSGADGWLAVDHDFQNLALPAEDSPTGNHHYWVRFR